MLGGERQQPVGAPRLRHARRAAARPRPPAALPASPPVAASPSPYCRFYYRCTHCSAEFCMKTDPKNAGACPLPAGSRARRSLAGGAAGRAAGPAFASLLCMGCQPAALHPFFAAAATQALPPLNAWKLHNHVCADYELEAGATRNYEPWRDKEKATAAAVASREEEERGNAMKARGWGQLLRALLLARRGRHARQHAGGPGCSRPAGTPWPDLVALRQALEAGTLGSKREIVSISPTRQTGSNASPPPPPPPPDRRWRTARWTASARWTSCRRWTK